MHRPYILTLLKLMLKLSSLASTRSWLVQTVLALDQIDAPMIIACVIVATSSFECELSQRDTTSAVNILNLASHSSHSFLLSTNLLLTKLLLLTTGLCNESQFGNVEGYCMIYGCIYKLL